MITFGSLFAGVGGFDQGFEKAGMRCLWQCEIDKNCQKLLHAKWPDAKLHDDVTTFNPDDFECPTVICFGSPCQDLSVAGLRAGIHDGERSSLFFVATGIIRRFVERGLEFAIWEQVPGAFSSDSGRDFACVLREMAKLGAVDVAWSVLDAQFFGVAQRRERVFLVVDFRGERAAEVLSFADCLQGDPAPRREPGQSVIGTVSSRTKGGGGLGTDFEIGGGCSRSLKATDGGIDREDAHTLIAHTLTQPINGCELEGRRSDNLIEVPEIAWALQERDAKGADSSTKEGHLIPTRRGGFFDGPTATLSSSGAGTARTGNARTESDMLVVADPLTVAEGKTCSHAGNNAGKTHNIIPVVGHLNGRGQPDSICPALNGTDAGDTSDMRPVVAGHGYGVRRLMPVECERLMGWPDGHTAGFSDSVRYRMAGNGVVSTVAEWIGKRIVAALRQ